LNRIGATHVFAYDKVFSKRSWDPLFALIEQGPAVVGASCAVKKGCVLPDAFDVIGENTKDARGRQEWLCVAHLEKAVIEILNCVFLDLAYVWVC
jgi:hypothetical protein